VVVVLVVATLLGGASLFGLVSNATQRLARESETDARVSREHVRHVQVIAGHLAQADRGSLEGFDLPGSAVQYTFRRVLGRGREGSQLGPRETIAWVPGEEEADDGRVVGSVVLFGTGGAKRLLADSVPEGGFSLRRAGAKLELHLGTRHAREDGRVVEIASEHDVELAR
jgi:hypothetical protein